MLVKLPGDIQSRWQRHAYRYKSQHNVDFPLFQEFASFIQEIARERNDPYLSIEIPSVESREPRPPLKPPKGKVLKGLSTTPPPLPRAEQANGPILGQGLTALRTEISDSALKDSAPRDPVKWCVIHKLCHSLGKCRVFKSKSLVERKALLTQHRICFRCLASNNHLAKDCTAVVKCSECQSDKHLAALHTGPIDKPTTQVGQQQEVHQPGEEPSQVSASCTEIWGGTAGSRSCSETCLACIYVSGHPANKIKAYVVIDDQSNCSLAKPKLFDLLNLGGDAKPYTLKTCSGTSRSSGRHAHDLLIESLDGTCTLTLPVLTECNAIPDSREEIPTPNVARALPHLLPIANKIPELCQKAEILLLLVEMHLPFIKSTSLEMDRRMHHGPSVLTWDGLSLETHVWMELISLTSCQPTEHKSSATADLPFYFLVPTGYALNMVPQQTQQPTW